MLCRARSGVGEGVILVAAEDVQRLRGAEYVRLGGVVGLRAREMGGERGGGGEVHTVGTLLLLLLRGIGRGAKHVEGGVGGRGGRGESGGVSRKDGVESRRGPVTVEGRIEGVQGSAVSSVGGGIYVVRAI